MAVTGVKIDLSPKITTAAEDELVHIREDCDNIAADANPECEFYKRFLDFSNPG